MPLVWRANDFEFRNLSQAGDSAQAIFDDFDLRGQLCVILQLLKIAAATPTKIRTRWFNPIGRRCDDLFDRPKCDASLLSFNANAETITGRRQGDHDCLVTRMSQAQPAR